MNSTPRCLGRLAAGVLSMVQRAGVVPNVRLDFSALRSILVTGSPLPEATWDWVYESVSSTVRLGSDSGGTDVTSAFIGTNPYQPVYRGEIMGPYLGVAAESWNSRGERVWDEVGELVITTPMPSMPVGFWNDPDGSKYRAAYFDAYPGVWRHGDWVTSAIVSREKSDSSIPARPWVTPSHMAGTPPATCAVAPAAWAARRIRSGKRS